MNNNFETINPEEIKDNVFELIGNDWMLITAGKKNDFNTMTASWGGLGVLWSKNVCFCFVRFSRYTYEFMEREEVFTLSFFEEQHRDILKYCGSHSGRDVDKIAETGLKPVCSKSGGIYYEQARLAIESRKIYFQNIEPERFLSEDIFEYYPEEDFHRMYTGEIENVYMKRGKI